MAFEYGIHSMQAYHLFQCNAYDSFGHRECKIFFPQNLPGTPQMQWLHISHKIYVLYQQKNFQPMANMTCWKLLSVLSTVIWEMMRKDLSFLTGIYFWPTVGIDNDIVLRERSKVFQMHLPWKSKKQYIHK